MNLSSSVADKPRVVTAGDLSRIEAFLEFDAAMEPIRGVRLSIETGEADVTLSFHRVTEFKVDTRSWGPQWPVQLAIQDISSRQWERVRFQVVNEEQEVSIDFY